MFGKGTFGTPETTKDGDTAYVLVKVEPPAEMEMPTLTLRFRMLKEDGAWKCDKFGLQR